MEALTLNVNVNSGGGGGSGGGAPGVGAMLSAGAAGGVAGAGVTMLADAVGQAFSKVLNSSPMLKGTMEIIDSMFNLILRPIGDIFAAFIRPLIPPLMAFAIKANEWLQSVDGKAMMQIFQGMGEVLAGLGTILTPIIQIVGGGALATAGFLSGNDTLIKIGQTMVENGMASLASAFSEGNTLILGGLGRIGVATELMGQHSEAASLALDKLAQMDASAIVKNLVDVGGSANTLANNLMTSAQRVLDATSGLTNKTNNQSGITEFITNKIDVGDSDKPVTPAYFTGGTNQEGFSGYGSPTTGAGEYFTFGTGTPTSKPPVYGSPEWAKEVMGMGD